MFDRLQAAWIALTRRKVIVVAKGYQFSTADDSSCIQANGYVKIEAKL